MHPRFQGLFVDPKSHKPLIFFGNVEESDGIPIYVMSPDQTWPEEVVKELEKCQEEVRIKKTWTDGFLWAYGQPEMYPVISGIPVFVAEDTTWPPIDVKKLREEKRIENRWSYYEQSMPEDKLSEFAKRMAESEGLILDIASGPGGGFVPMILHMNRKATILMNELGFGVLQEWQRVLKDKSVPNASFALFDARRMPVRSDSIDMVGEISGFDNIQRGEEAVNEAYRVLKAGGTLFSLNSMIEKGDFLKLPREFREKWYNINPPVYDGFLGAFKRAGFKEISHDLFREREMSPDEGDLPGEAAKHGVRLHIKEYCTEVVK